MQAPAEEWKGADTALAEAAVAAAAGCDTRSHLGAEPPQSPGGAAPDPPSLEASQTPSLRNLVDPEPEASMLPQHSQRELRTQHAAPTMEPSVPHIHGTDRDDVVATSAPRSGGAPGSHNHALAHNNPSSTVRHNEAGSLEGMASAPVLPTLSELSLRDAQKNVLKVRIFLIYSGTTALLSLLPPPSLPTRI